MPQATRKKTKPSKTDGTCEAMTYGPLNVTCGERDIITALRRIPGYEADKVKTVRAIIEFVTSFADGVRVEAARHQGIAP